VVAVAQTESLPEGATGETEVAAEGMPEAAMEPPGEQEAPYRGDNPPSGFTIKGNEGSMLYHRPDSSMYDRTKAEVWFRTEEDAVAAGFTLAGTHPKPKDEGDG
jgi:hypothetical protein